VNGVAVAPDLNPVLGGFQKDLDYLVKLAGLASKDSIQFE